MIYASILDLLYQESVTARMCLIVSTAAGTGPAMSDQDSKVHGGQLAISLYRLLDDPMCILYGQNKQ